MKTGILIIFFLAFIGESAMAKEDAIAINIDLNKKTQLITLTLINTSDSDIVIENSFGFTQKELEASPEGMTIEALSSDPFKYPYGIGVMLASEDMKPLSITEVSVDGYISNRILASQLLKESKMKVRRNVNYIKRLHLYDILGGMERHVGFDALRLPGLFVKIRLDVFLKEPVITKIQKETDWVQLNVEHK